MQAPYEKTVELEIESGDDAYVPIPFPHRGTLSKFHLVQVSGEADGFEADLYNSAGPLADVQESASSTSLPANNLDPTAHQILPTQVVAGPATAVMLSGESCRFPYRNVDGTFSVPQRFLYLRLNASGGGTKVFQLTLGVLPVM